MIRLAGSPTPLNHGTARVTGLEWVPYRRGQQTADRLTCESRWLKFAPELFLSRHPCAQAGLCLCFIPLCASADGWTFSNFLKHQEDYLVVRGRCCRSLRQTYAASSTVSWFTPHRCLYSYLYSFLPSKDGWDRRFDSTKRYDGLPSRSHGLFSCYPGLSPTADH